MQRANSALLCGGFATQGVGAVGGGRQSALESCVGVT
jgi:hypothetical protein